MRLRQDRGAGRIAVALMVATALSGCMGSGFPGLGATGEDVSRAAPVGTFAQTQAERGEEHRSSTIDALIARRSALPPGSPYAQVAEAVLAASSRTAESELLRARMRAKAADKNWLPRLGPNLSLTSLSSLVASLVIDTVLFDNGRRAAERDFARADVEAAAVNLAIDQNDRVHSALALYLKAAEARAKAEVMARAGGDMAGLDRIMTARVKGGVSDMSEQNVIRAKLGELAASAEAEQGTAATALAELQAMAAGPLPGLGEVPSLTLPGTGARALSLFLAHAERDRDTAQSEMERAGLLPGLAGAAEIGGGGVNGGVRLTSDQGIGFDLFDTMRASEAGAEAAGRRVAQAEEDAARRLASLRETHAAALRRHARARTLAEAGRQNADLFARQVKAGTRPVLEGAGMIETMARLEADVVAARFEVARAEIEIARELGLLADGDKV